VTPDQIMKSIESLSPEDKKALASLAEKKVAEMEQAGGRRKRRSKRRSSKVPK
jgi:hypothetical protein